MKEITYDDCVVFLGQSEISLESIIQDIKLERKAYEAIKVIETDGFVEYSLDVYNEVLDEEQITSVSNKDYYSILIDSNFMVDGAWNVEFLFVIKCAKDVVNNVYNYNFIQQLTIINLFKSKAYQRAEL